MQTLDALARNAFDEATAADITATVAGQTVPSWFLRTVDRAAEELALVADDGQARRTWTWEAYGRDAGRVAAGLAELGIGRGDRVALMLRNRPEFHLADMGALLLGATPFSIYNSSAPAQIEYQLAHSEARAILVEDADFLHRVLEVRDGLPSLRHVIVLDPAAAGPGVTTFDDLLDHEPRDLEQACAIAQPQDLASLVYTSGTTGPPKGAMLAHDRICWVLESFRRRLGVDMEGKRLVSYLPMAHVLERDVSHYLHVLAGAQVFTCPDPARLGAALRQVRPEFFAAVPRVWEKLRSVLLAADAVSADLDELRGQDEETVLAPARALLGLDACESAFSGGAPLPADTLRFFRALGVPLGEGYGLTESTFVVTFDAVRPRVGAVGRGLPGIELAIATDGEVLARGPFVFAGYLKDEARTREAVDAAGWLHTGDIGRLDGEGYLTIVDRKKELIITAGGKNVSPANIESALKGHPLIGQACVIGDARPHLVALLVLDAEVAPGWAREHGVAAAGPAELAADPTVRDAVLAAVGEVNRDLSRAEGIKRIALLHEEWLPDSAELTPTMKLKRRGIAAAHAAVIDALYAGDTAIGLDVVPRTDLANDLEVQ